MSKNWGIKVAFVWGMCYNDCVLKGFVLERIGFYEWTFFEGVACAAD